MKHNYYDMYDQIPNKRWRWYNDNITDTMFNNCENLINISLLFHGFYFFHYYKSFRMVLIRVIYKNARIKYNK